LPHALQAGVGCVEATGERGMRKFKSINQVQRFLNAHAAVYNLFNLVRHLVSAEIYRNFRLHAFVSWEKATGI
jgi:putative transposase